MRTVKKLLNKLDEIGEKAEYLSRRTDDLVAENRSLKGKISVLEEQLAQREMAHTELSDQFEIIRMARSVKGEDGGKEAQELKQKINEYIREIDQCLKLIGS